MSTYRAWWINGILALTLIAGSVACGCDDDDDDDDDGGAGDDDDDDDVDDDDTFAEMSVATFNAGLARGYVPYALERTDLIGERLAAGVAADVLCLQEVWLEEDIESITDAVADVYPFAYRYDSHADWLALPDEPAPCDDLADVEQCAEDNCADLSGAAFTDCMTTNCIADLAELTAECFVCLAAYIDKPIADIIDQCTLPGPEPRQYEGANGLLMLSKQALQNAEYKPLDSFLITRGVLYGAYETDIGPMHAFCTHLSTQVDPVPYLGEFDDYEAENLQQAIDLIEYSETKTSVNGEASVFMGDFNAGPFSDGITAVYQNTYDQFSDWNDEYFVNTPFCTWCVENPFTGSLFNHIIDHVFLRAAWIDGVETDRIFDEEITIPTEDGDVAGRLSDHYGVWTTFAFSNENTEM